MNQKLKIKKKYHTVNSELREEILDMLVNQNIKPSIIARNLNLNLSTVKAIHRIFKKEGRIRRKEKHDIQVYCKQKFVILMTDEVSFQVISSASYNSQTKVPFMKKISNEYLIEQTLKNFKENEQKILDHLNSEAKINWEQNFKSFQKQEWKDIQDIGRKSVIPRSRFMELLRSIMNSDEQQILQKLENFAPPNINHEIKLRIRDLEQQHKQMLAK